MDKDQSTIFEAYKTVVQKTLLNEAPPVDLSADYYEPATQTVKKQFTPEDFPFPEGDPTQFVGTEDALGRLKYYAFKYARMRTDEDGKKMYAAIANAAILRLAQVAKEKGITTARVFEGPYKDFRVSIIQRLLGRFIKDSKYCEFVGRVLDNYLRNNLGAYTHEEKRGGPASGKKYKSAEDATKALSDMSWD